MDTFFDSPQKKKSKRSRGPTTHKITSTHFISQIKPSIVQQTDFTFQEISKFGIYSNVTKEIFAESSPELAFSEKWQLFQIYFIVVGLFHSLDYLLSKKKSTKLNNWCEILHDIERHLAKSCNDISCKYGKIQANMNSSAMVSININKNSLQGILVYAQDDALIDLIIECLDHFVTMKHNYNKYEESLIGDHEAYTIAAQFMANKFNCFIRQYEKKHKNKNQRISSFTPSRSNSSSNINRRKRRRKRSDSPILL
eukprot:471014_1